MADLTRSEAWELLTKYNKEPFHLRHALTVEGIMKYFAKELGYADETGFWAQVGLLHDLDLKFILLNTVSNHRKSCANTDWTKD